jgi:hypothetical protein
MEEQAVRLREQAPLEQMQQMQLPLQLLQVVVKVVMGLRQMAMDLREFLLAVAAVVHLGHRALQQEE